MKRLVKLLGVALGAALPCAAAGQDGRDPTKDLYADYAPDYARRISEAGRNGSGLYSQWRKTEPEMELSSERGYFTLNLVHEDARANALVEAALNKEKEGQHREALKMYQIVIDKYRDALYRVSSHGIFVPISQYCQRRILGFPRADLAFYRTLYDARAKEAFEQARRKNSLSGLSDILDTMLATSYGDRASLELGNAALDAGHFLEALEYFTSVRDFFPDSPCRTPELALKIATCEKTLGTQPKPGKGPAAPAPAPSEDAERLRKVLESATPPRAAFHAQRASAPHAGADDYTLFPPTADPMALSAPAWEHDLPGSRRDFFVYTQPVVTEKSVLYRHKNIVYSRSILNGELRWVNDLGGRVVWQNWEERQYPQEDLLVQDGLVFTALHKVGPSLVALDEVTGQLRWAYGPVAASTEEEARMRFEAAPAGGPRTVYAGYVLDNIEGETHTDTEYGLIAFDSASGRVRWRTPLCRLQPGKFAGGFVERRRNRIRSFTSPPLYHEGTVYCTTNAGATAALDSRSGRIKWLARYPYYEGVHDATRKFGTNMYPIHGGTEPVRPHTPMFWFNQRPLLVDETLYVLSVDSPFLLALDRRSGRVRWSTVKAYGPAMAYFLGPMSTGELVVVYSGRDDKRVFGWGQPSVAPVHLLDPATGKTVWTAPDLILPESRPVMRHYYYYTELWFGMNERWFETAARPFLTADDRLYVPSWTDVSIYWRPGCYVFHLAGLSLKERKILDRRRYYAGATLAHAHWMITEAVPRELQKQNSVAAKDKSTHAIMDACKEVMADRVPENEHGPFMPASRITFERYGTPFELRLSARTISVAYDRAAVRQVVEKRTDPEADFARAELAVSDGRLDEAAALLKKCGGAISSEDLDARAAIHQQLFQIHQELARRSIRAARTEEEVEHGLGMSRTAGTLAEEIASFFALSEAYERRGDSAGAARCLRSVIATYRDQEVPVAVSTEPDALLGVAGAVMDQARGFVNREFYSEEMTRSLSLLKKGLPLYFSTVSPLPKTLTVRAGELAADRLARVARKSPELARALEEAASRELEGRPPEEQLHRLWEFPGTGAAQKILDALFVAAETMEEVPRRRRLWRLADAARVCGLKVPDAQRARVFSPDSPEVSVPLAVPFADRKLDFADAESTARLVLERKDDRSRHANLLFLGGRVRRRLDNKFLLTCVDLETAKVRWETADLRLKGRGEEPGFFEAFVHGDLVVVHGLYDVLAFAVADGALRWRYAVPFDFEIKEVAQSGDLLVLSGQAETLALYVPTSSAAGEVVWQEKETGDVYIPPYFRGETLVSVRKLPFNLTVRFRGTGKLVGRLALPDLSLHEKHPLLENGPEELPAARDGDLLVVTDGWYYIAVDVRRMAIRWKRPIDQNDITREPAMRLFLKGEYLAVLKEDYDQKAIYMLSSRTGEVLWSTKPKDSNSPRPMHSIVMDGERAFGLMPHPGQGFYFVGLDCRTGRRLFAEAREGFQGAPKAALRPGLFGAHAVVEVEDRQEFELDVLDLKSGRGVHALKLKGVGPFGVHGRVSSSVQNGRLILLSKATLGL